LGVAYYKFAESAETRAEEMQALSSLHSAVSFI